MEAPIGEVLAARVAEALETPAEAEVVKAPAAEAEVVEAPAAAETPTTEV
jgi:hypothetical protein